MDGFSEERSLGVATQQVPRSSITTLFELETMKLTYVSHQVSRVVTDIGDVRDMCCVCHLWASK